MQHMRYTKDNVLVLVPCEDEPTTMSYIIDRMEYKGIPGTILPMKTSSRAPMAKLRAGYEMTRTSGVDQVDIVGYIHSDVEIYEDKWLDRTLKEFERDMRVGVVGWGGALQLGADNIYKVPYDLHQLARFGYRSNVEDAEAHGVRETGSVDVATLDGFALFMRRQVLDELGGWPTVEQLPFHNYDNWLCAKAQENGWKVRMVGVFCKHLGGGTSVKVEEGGESWSEWAKRVLGKTDEEIHRDSHVWLYEELRGVLPIRTGQKE